MIARNTTDVLVEAASALRSVLDRDARPLDSSCIVRLGARERARIEEAVRAVDGALISLGLSAHDSACPCDSCVRRFGAVSLRGRTDARPWSQVERNEAIEAHARAVREHLDPTPISRGPGCPSCGRPCPDWFCVHCEPSCAPKDPRGAA